jgi:hypothetical protein
MKSSGLSIDPFCTRLKRKVGENGITLMRKKVIAMLVCAQG